MTPPTATLVRQLADPTTRNAARAELIRRGPSAVEELLSALNGEVGSAQRRSIMSVLVELKDRRAEEQFRRSLRSDDEVIRALSARGLYLLGAPDALEACLSTLDDAPDVLHFDVTPSVNALAEMGLSVLPALLPLLDASDPRTRQRAQKVLERVTFKAVSRAVNPRALSDRARSEWTALWKANGSYEWDAPQDERRTSIQRWREWTNQRVG